MGRDMASTIHGKLNRRPALLEAPAFDEVGSPYIALNALTKLLAWNVQERACIEDRASAVRYKLPLSSNRSGYDELR